MNTSIEQENYNKTFQLDSSFPEEDIHHSPRCSTPIFDRCVGSNRMLYLPDEIMNAPIAVENRGEYNEWKKRLEHKKTPRKFKVRGPGKESASEKKECEQKVENCSVISGYFELKLSFMSERINKETIQRPAPVYQMWFPITNYQTYWSPMNYLTNYHQQNHPQTFYGFPAGVQQTQTQYNLQPAQFFSIFSNDHHHHHHQTYRHNYNNNNCNLQSQGINGCPNYCMAKVNNMNYCTVPNSAPQILTRHFYYQYPQATTQLMTYCGNTHSNLNYYNVPLHGGSHFAVAMNQ